MNTKPVRKICRHCGSEDVTHDALARWEMDTQQWEVSSTLDNSDCDRCGGECTTVNVPMDYDPWKYPRAVDRVRVLEHASSGCFDVLHYPAGRSPDDLLKLETFAFVQHANKAAQDFASGFDDCLVQLDGEDYS